MRVMLTVFAAFLMVTGLVLHPPEESLAETKKLKIKRIQMQKITNNNKGSASTKNSKIVSESQKFRRQKKQSSDLVIKNNFAMKTNKSGVGKKEVAKYKKSSSLAGATTNAAATMVKYQSKIKKLNLNSSATKISNANTATVKTTSSQTYKSNAGNGNSLGRTKIKPVAFKTLKLMP